MISVPVYNTAMEFPLDRICAARSVGEQIIEREGLVCEAPGVAIEVERHRWAWKPDRVHLALIAESHVYTSPDDLAIELRNNLLPTDLRNLPKHFVRLVYCLGYGDDSLLGRPTQTKNSGTWQYWKLFGECAGTLPYQPNLSWKISTLRELKKRGI